MSQVMLCHADQRSLESQLIGFNRAAEQLRLDQLELFESILEGVGSLDLNPDQTRAD